jgi:hypothetical protein
MSFVDDLSRVSDQFPNSVQHHCLFCLITADLLALLCELLGHCCHLCCQLCLLRFQCVHLRPVCLLGQFPGNVSGHVVVQRPTYAPGDVLQPEILVLQVGQLLPDSLERSFWKLKGGQTNVPPLWLPAWTGLVSGLRNSRLRSTSY